jgi:hypothetical protein
MKILSTRRKTTGCSGHEFIKMGKWFTQNGKMLAGKGE